MVPGSNSGLDEDQLKLNPDKMERLLFLHSNDENHGSILDGIALSPKNQVCSGLTVLLVLTFLLGVLIFSGPRSSFYQLRLNLTNLALQYFQM